MFCDFHTHLHQYSETDELLFQIPKHKIISIACSMDIESYAKTKRIAKISSFIVPTFGIHPLNANKSFPESEISSLLNESKIIGEIGLDYCWAKDIGKKQQESIFELILDHCNRESKYCVIHTKGAEKRIIEILANYPNCKPIIHWYHGPGKYFRKIIDNNYLCTFGCEVSHSSYIRKLLAYIPTDLLLAETDNPESEIWLGGQRRDPMLIENVILDIANVKSMELQKMNDIILKNSLKILQESKIAVLY